MIKPQIPKGRVAVFIDAANIDLRNCEFAKKKLPFGSDHNNLSTAKKIYHKK